MRPPRRTRQVLRLLSPGETRANARPVAILANPRAGVLSGAHQGCTPKMSDRMEQSIHPAAEPTDARRRRQQMMAQPRVTNAWWMSSRISQRTRRRRNQCSQSDRSFRDLAVDAEAGAVFGAAPGDVRVIADRPVARLPQQRPDGRVTAMPAPRLRPTPGGADASVDRRVPVDRKPSRRSRPARSPR